MGEENEMAEKVGVARGIGRRRAGGVGHGVLTREHIRARSNSGERGRNFIKLAWEVRRKEEEEKKAGELEIAGLGYGLGIGSAVVAACFLYLSKVIRRRWA